MSSESDSDDEASFLRDSVRRAEYDAVQRAISQCSSSPDRSVESSVQSKTDISINCESISKVSACWWAAYYADQRDILQCSSSPNHSIASSAESEWSVALDTDAKDGEEDKEEDKGEKEKEESRTRTLIDSTFSASHQHRRQSNDMGKPVSFS